MKVLRRIARFNKREIPSDITLKAQRKEGKTSGGFFNLFKPMRMARQTSVQFYAWYASQELIPLSSFSTCCIFPCNVLPVC